MCNKEQMSSTSSKCSPVAKNPQAVFKYAAHKLQLAAADKEFVSGTMIRLENQQPPGFILPFFNKLNRMRGMWRGACLQGGEKGRD